MHEEQHRGENVYSASHTAATIDGGAKGSGQSKKAARTHLAHTAGPAAQRKGRCTGSRFRRCTCRTGLAYRVCTQTESRQDCSSPTLRSQQKRRGPHNRPQDHSLPSFLHSGRNVDTANIFEREVDSGEGKHAPHITPAGLDAPGGQTQPGLATQAAVHMGDFVKVSPARPARWRPACAAAQQPQRVTLAQLGQAEKAPETRGV
jgi:hypothetical protein